jgi:hypothetical protein
MSLRPQRAVDRADAREEVPSAGARTVLRTCAKIRGKIRPYRARRRHQRCRARRFDAPSSPPMDGMSQQRGASAGRSFRFDRSRSLFGRTIVPAPILRGPT